MMQVVVRADASRRIGTGHVMRCLCLAEMLASYGCQVCFVCRPQDGDLIDRIIESGFCVVTLPAIATWPEAGGYADWLGTTEAQDALETSEALGDRRPDWVIVDHYALGESWQQIMRQTGAQILAIDDLANRLHDCDILLDQTLGRTPDEYRARVPSNTTMLLGPGFALLRPEFAAARGSSIPRSRHWPPKRILISLGGVDQSNATGQVLSALAQTDLGHETEVVVVLGSNAPWIDKVRKAAKALPFHTDVLVDARNLAETMSACDLAIGAPGTSAWERCAVGLPSVMLILADNQRPNAQALANAGAGLVMGSIEDLDIVTGLKEAFRTLARPDAMGALSARAAQLLDGHGARRVAGKILGKSLSSRVCEAGDSRNVWTWREAGGAARLYRSGTSASWADHEAWFSQALTDPSRLLLMCGLPDRDVAHVRLDRLADDPGTVAVGICLDPDLRGLGLSLPCLLTAMDHARANGITHALAEVHCDNAASLRLFTQAGFRDMDQDGPFTQFSLELSAQHVVQKNPQSESIS